MKLDDIAKYIIAAGEKADNNLRSSFREFLSLSKDILESKAPVDSGDFKKSWEIHSTQFSSYKMRAILGNDRPYAGAIEFGSAPGQSPWPNPGEKTTMSGGRIYSTQAVGGTMDAAFSEKNVIKFAEGLAKAITRAFK